MDVPNSIANGYLQLGIAGAALLIVLVNTILNSRQNTKIINSEGQKVEKLCDKIDDLVTTLTRVLVTNEKDNKGIKDQLKLITEIAIENQKRLTRVDDRTSLCLKNKEEESK